MSAAPGSSSAPKETRINPACLGSYRYGSRGFPLGNRSTASSVARFWATAGWPTLFVVMAADRTIKLDPEKSILGYRVGDEIALTEAEFVRLSAGFFAEIEDKFLAAAAA